MKKQQYAFYIIVFVNAFVDLGHKIIIQNTFYATETALHFSVMSAIVNAMILLPYIFLFTPSGFIADRYAKVQVMRITALAAIPLTIAITICYYLGAFWPAFAMTLLLGAQATLNSPAKYGFIKEHFGVERISKINGIVQTIVILAILAGTFLFSLLFQYLIPSQNWSGISPYSKGQIMQMVAPVGFLLILSSISEAWLTFKLPLYSAVDPTSQFEWKKYSRLVYERDFLKITRKDRNIFICIIGLAVFWGINQVLLANYGAFLKEYVTNATPGFVNGALAIGGIGILLGALYAGKISRNYIETGLIPVAAVGIALCILIMPQLTTRILIPVLFLVYGFFGGMLIVPLNALIQFNAPRSDLGKILAANNFIQTLFMFGFLVIAALLSSIHLPSTYMLYGLFFMALAGTIYTLYRLPQFMARYFIYFIVSKFYNVEVTGLHNLPVSGGVLLLGNHTSFLDWAILQIASPRPVRFVMERSIYDKWYLTWILRGFKVIPISSGGGSKEALANIQTALKQGEVVILFPEGYITRNGHVGNFRHGYEFAIKDTKAIIVPFYLRGLWGTMSSYAGQPLQKSTRGRLRHVSVCFGDPIANTIDANSLKRIVMHLSYQSWQTYANHLPSIPEAWLKQAKVTGKQLAMADAKGRAYTGYEMIAAVWLLKKRLENYCKRQTTIGILLPPTTMSAMTNLALLSLGKIIVNLNYTVSAEVFSTMITAANINIIITSEKFLTKLTNQEINIMSLLSDKTVITLESLQEKTNQLVLFRHYLPAKWLPYRILCKIICKKTDPTQTAAILFSQRNQSSPKGVELSHRNIITNAKQMAYLLNTGIEDKFLGSLPMYHALGLTVTTLLSLFQGVPVIFSPDPSDAQAIGRAIAKFKITFLCSTASILTLYANNPKLHPLMLNSLRMIIAGAEKLSPATQEAFKKIFNLEIFESYGTTETSPMISLNLPDILIPDYWHVQQGEQVGSVGMPIPGTQIKIVDPATLQEIANGETGLILVAGPQVMKAYLNAAEKTQQAIIENAGIRWYKTGDQGYLDAQGFLTIVR